MMDDDHVDVDLRVCGVCVSVRSSLYTHISHSPPSTPKEKVEEDDQQQEPRDKKHENGQDKVESLSKKKKAKHSLWYIIRHTDNGGKVGHVTHTFIQPCCSVCCCLVDVHHSQ